MRALPDRPPVRGEKIKTQALQDAIFNSAYFSSIATDELGVIQIFNVGAERMLGYAAADVVDRITPADISDPDELVARATALSHELDTVITPGFEALVFKASRGLEDIYELTYVRQDGSRFPAIVSVTALRDAFDAIIGYLLIGTDNTARKQVEAKQALLDQQLRDQQYYTRSLIESNLDALMTTDPDGIVSDVNEQMIALTGRSRDELIGAPSRTLFTDPAGADAAIRRVLQENRVADYELTVLARDGSQTVVSYNAATIHDREGNLQGVFAAARDMTDRKVIERRLVQKNDELVHASRMKSEFLATMSHELRTPLNAIIGFSEALRDGLMGDMSPEQHEYIGDIFDSGQHLLSLINDILDLSKVEAGMMALELDVVDIGALLANSLSIVREKAASQQISLELDATGDLGHPQLDSRKVKQIVYNLLSNAVKFGAGGRVVLGVRSVTRSEVGSLPGDRPTHTFALPDNGHEEFLEVSVTDSGMGIERQDLPRLFRSFSQIDSSLAREFEGTGLGLAMVKQLSVLHGGTVAVASVAGQGSTFAAWLPLRLASPRERPVAVAPPAVDEAHSLGAALVVEDDEASAELLRLLLDAEGFQVVRAHSAEEALELAPQQLLSLITLDVQLPGMDGWQFLATIKEQADLAQVPVVVIAGDVDSSLALARGATAILQKPVRRAQLTASLTDLGLHEGGPARTVLVVDDDPKAVELVATLLPAPQYTVIRCYGGAEAVVLARRLLPDLVLLDLMMPDVTGFEVVQALQQDPTTAAIPVLVVTAKQITAEDRQNLRAASDAPVAIVPNAGFDRSAFLGDVRRALASVRTEAAHGDDPRR